MSQVVKSQDHEITTHDQNTMLKHCRRKHNVL